MKEKGKLKTANKINKTVKFADFLFLTFPSIHDAQLVRGERLIGPTNLAAALARSPGANGIGFVIIFVNRRNIQFSLIATINHTFTGYTEKFITLKLFAGTQVEPNRTERARAGTGRSGAECE